MSDGDGRFPSGEAKHLAEGEAALVLVESLILTLIEKRVIAPDDMLQAVEDVIQVKRQMAEDGITPELSRLAAGILSQVANSVAAVQQPDGEDAP